MNARARSLELNGRSLTPITHPSPDLRLRIHGDISPLLHTSLKRGIYFETGTYSAACSFVQITVDFLLMICRSVFFTNIEHECSIYIYDYSLCVLSSSTAQTLTTSKYPFNFLITKRRSIFA